MRLTYYICTVGGDEARSTAARLRALLPSAAAASARLSSSDESAGPGVTAVSVPLIYLDDALDAATLCTSATSGYRAARPPPPPPAAPPYPPMQGADAAASTEVAICPDGMLDAVCLVLWLTPPLALLCCLLLCRGLLLPLRRRHFARGREREDVEALLRTTLYAPGFLVPPDARRSAAIEAAEAALRGATEARHLAQRRLAATKGLADEEATLQAV